MKLLSALPLAASLIVCQTFCQTRAKIDAGEYFVDFDPGTGNATPLQMMPVDSTVSLNFKLPAVSSGVHTLFIRFHDTAGRWGMPEGRTLFVRDTIQTVSSQVAQIVAGEYFLDTDLGIGAGTSITPGSPSNAVTLTAAIVPKALSLGFHIVGARVLDSDGRWSMPLLRTFYLRDSSRVSQPPQTQIAGFEYFYDAEPGVGSGIQIPLTSPLFSVSNYSLAVPTAGLYPGVHSLSIRALGTSGLYGFAAESTFTARNLPVLSLSTKLISFGHVLTDGSSHDTSFYFSNRGSDTLRVDSLVLAGADAGSYKILSGNGKSVLPPGSTRDTVRIRFQPQAYGARSALLSFVANDTATVGLQGIGDGAAPGQPALISPPDSLPNAATAVVFQWSSALRGEKYRLQVGTDPLLKPPLSVDDTTDKYATPFQVNGLGYDTQYFWEVTSSNVQGGPGKPSSVRSFRTRLAPPQNLRASLVGATKLAFSWDSVTSASRYRVYRSRDSISYGYLDSTRSLSYADSGLTPGARYWYRLTAVRTTELEGDTSTSLSFVTNPAAPQNVTLSVRRDTIFLSWLPVGLAAQFKVFRSIGDSLGFGQIAVTSVPSYADTVLSPHTTYFYRIAALNDARVLGPPSATVSFRTHRSLPTVSAIAGPKGPVRKDVPFIVSADFTGDTVRLGVQISVDSGQTWRPTPHVDGVTSGITGKTTDSLIWHSLQDLPDTGTALARMQVVPIGLEDTGFSAFTNAFTVNNKAPSFKGPPASIKALYWNSLMVKLDTAYTLTPPVRYVLFRTRFDSAFDFTKPLAIRDSLQIDSLFSSTTYRFLVRAQDTLGNTVDDSVGISGAKTGALADYNADGKIDATDLASFATNWPNTDKKGLAILTPVDSSAGFPRMRVLGSRSGTPSLDDFYIFSKLWLYSKYVNPAVPLSLRDNGGRYDTVVHRELTVTRGATSARIILAPPLAARVSSWGVRAYFPGSIEVDSLDFPGRTFVLAFKDTIRRVFYADCASGSVQARTSDTLAHGVVRMTRSGTTDSLVLVSEGSDPVTRKQLRYVEIFTVREIPSTFVLYQNYPNPFNPSTTISFDLPADGRVSLVIYDILGREVQTLINDNLTAGYYKKVFDAHQLATGVYIYRLRTPNASKVQKMLLIK